jgi:hypothetical protein
LAHAAQPAKQKRETHRCLIGDGIPDARGVLHYEIKSQHREGVRHRVTVRKDTGECTCSCENFRYVHERHNPTVWSDHVCKHIASFRENLTKDALRLATDEAITAVIDTAEPGSHYRFLVSFWWRGTQLEMSTLHTHTTSIQHAYRIAETVRSEMADTMSVRILNISGVTL